ncbi:restriction endonuclease subunit S [Candidatus Cryosericum septentrionale]|jgi:type I restriction enzyme S subunit|uniref:Restriction endonuclease subunit S n=1 Tax=Candidatus Cryosericum septentrionale TaxID=2290913 RepID=A0A398DP00_9BACT|nr:restriction endonuclease subunit S [Candidatus Cryosericum septentrionale]RIE17396.1 restriction endonuclease subunit S [Candidatus Cryosericum septentrionale]
MSKVRSYPHMEDSGIEWVGEIPTHWRILRLRSIFRNVSERNHPDAEVLSLYRDWGVLPKASRNDNHNVTSEDTTQYKFVRVGNLVINKMKAWQGSLAISGYEGIVSPAYYVCEFISEQVDKRFIHYLLRCDAYAQDFERLSTGMRVGQWDLGIGDFMRVPLICPSLVEQQEMSSYLDSACADINIAVAETKASIEEYKLLKQSVITQAVTKGLDPNVPMKDSGVEWIGEIPLTWNRGNLKVLFSFGRGLPITKADLTEDGVLVVSYGQIHAKTNTGTCLDDSLLRHVASSYLNTNVGSLIYNGDIVFADTSEDLEGMGNAVLMDRHEAVFAGYHTIVARPNDKTMSTYLAYLFRSDPWRSQLRSRATGIKVFSITQRMLKSCTVILPPEPDRSAIVSYLNSICARIDGLISEKQSMTSDLESYKKSLIYEVVTGKRRVA